MAVVAPVAKIVDNIQLEVSYVKKKKLNEIFNQKI